MFIQRGSAILRAPEGDNSGGGGAATFTEEQQAAIGQIVNSAVTSQLKRSLGPGIGEALKGVKWGEVLAEPFKALLEQNPGSGSGGGSGDDDPSKGGKGKGGDKGADSALQQQVQKLATDLENERKARAAAEEATRATEAKRLLDSATTAFRNGLQPNLRPELLDVAVGHFGSALKVSADGAPLLSVRKAPFKGAPEEDVDVPLAEGLQLLLTSEPMKPFLPPPGGDGSSRRGGAPSGTGGGAPSLQSKDPNERVAARLAALGLDFNTEFSS